MQSRAETCPRCGTPLGHDAAPGGLCPRCLLQLGFESDAGGAAEAGGRAPAPAPSLADLVPRFPELELTDVLGRGGMGAVYAARHRSLDRKVALKILPAEAALDPTWPERFAREARAMARLSHPGIVAVYDSGCREGLYYFAMELVDGTSLRQMIQARSASPSEALSIVGQICEALQYAHEEGVVHRDIKPENILIDRRGRVKIADFGLAKLVHGEKGDLTLTGSHQTLGTPHYMAPEQWEHPDRVDHRADIYSLGVVFYELLTGELPLGRFPPPSRKVQVDAGLDEVVLKTLAKEPELRYQQASQVKTDVEGASRRAERRADDDGSRLGRFVRRVRHTFDPRTSQRKKVGDVEVPSTWPLGVALFLALFLIAVVTGSELAMFVSFVAALVGLWWLVKHTA